MSLQFLRIAGVAITTGCLTAVIGCTDPTAIQPGDIRTYVAPITAPPKSQPSSPTAAPTSLAISYETPRGWTDLGASGIRLATLSVDAGSQQHEITVMRVGGTLEANVSRWIGQLDSSLPPEDLITRTKDFVSAAKKVSAGDIEATVVSLMDGKTPDSAEVILGAMLPLDEASSLFVTFKGPAGVARRERESFTRFVSSLRWNQESR